MKLDIVADLLHAESLEAAMAEGARLLADTADADAAAVFLADGNKPLREFWHASTEPKARFRAAFKRAALESARTGTPVDHDGLSEADGSRIHSIPLKMNGRVLGAAVVHWAGSPPARGADADEIQRPGGPEGARERALAATAAIVAYKASSHEEIAGHRVQRERDERWFKTLDGHLRVLDRERQKFAAFVNQTDTFVLVADLGRTIRWVNRAVTELFPDEGGSAWVGAPCDAVCTGLGDRCGDCPVALASASGRAAHGELRARVRGEETLLYLTALPIRGLNGRTDEILVTIQDLTGLESLRRSESRYRLLYEQNVDGIVMVDPADLRIVLANAAAASILQFDQAELLERRLPELHDSADWDRLEPRLRRCLADGSILRAESTLRTRHGEERLAQVAAVGLRLEGREVAMVIFRDVTEQRRAERALQRAEQRLRTVVAGSPIVLFAIDREGIFTLSEGRGLAALGMEPGQVVGESVFTLYRGTPEVGAHVRRALAGEAFEAVVQIGDLAFETRYSPVHDVDGTVQGVIGVATDVTERMRAERALRESEEALRRSEAQLRQAQKLEAVGLLAGGIAHDFNNLLTVVMTQSERLAQSLELDAAARRQAEEIHLAGARGARLTRQLLTFSRHDVLALRTFDLGEVVRGMEAALGPLAEDRIELRLAVLPEPLRVRSDREQIEQVVQNLAVNAREAMPSGGCLSIRAKRVYLDPVLAAELDVAAGTFAALEVEDTGHGMDAETQQRVFEPFFTTKERGKGTGLGLSTVYGIARGNGGSVTVRTEIGRGALFTVYIPLVEEPVVEAPVSSPAELITGGETILLAEDEPGVRAIGRELLQYHGYRVLEAENGAKALEAAERYPGTIHLLLSDVVMPVMGGRELAEKLLARRPGTRVLFVSGFMDDTILRHGILDAGFAFLQKPFTLESLSRKIRETLDAPAPAVPTLPGSPRSSGDTRTPPVHRGPPTP